MTSLVSDWLNLLWFVVFCCTDCPPSGCFLTFMTQMSPETGILYSGYSGGRQLVDHGKMAMRDKMKSHWKYARSCCAVFYVSGKSFYPVWPLHQSYRTTKTSLVTSITNTHCLWGFPIALVSFSCYKSKNGFQWTDSKQMFAFWAQLVNNDDKGGTHAFVCYRGWVVL